MFDYISRLLKVRQKYSAKDIFISLLTVWKCGETFAYFLGLNISLKSIIVSPKSIVCERLGESHTETR